MRVLIADDHELVVDAMKKYLNRIDPDVDVVGAATFEEAMERLHESNGLNLIILDLFLPDMPRLEGLTSMRNERPDVPIVMISGIANRREMIEALDRGAAGFIPKNLSSTAIVKALELVLTGERYIPSKIFNHSRLMAEETGYRQEMNRDAGGLLNKLTVREREVLSLLIKGCSNKEIARALGVKEITAAFHLRGVFKKLGVSNRTQAAAVALRLGWERTDVQ